MEHNIIATFERLLAWDVLSLAGGAYLLIAAIKSALGAHADKDWIKRFLFLAPFAICAGLAFVPDIFDGVTTIGAKLRMGLWTGGVAVFYHLLLKAVLGKRARDYLRSKVDLLLKRGG